MSYTQLTDKKIRPVPDMPTFLGKEALLFLREDCTDLLFQHPEPEEYYNFNRDVDRYALENAIERFMRSGQRDDAFDVYVCYCEMFKPFGSGYDSIRYLVEMLAEHESNSSSLLMKHRDHYTHSVYVFVLGMVIYRNQSHVRNAFLKKYNLDGSNSNKFLENWGLASLFHDIGYPFEIAHQQMKVYACSIAGIDKNTVNDVPEFAPFVSYKRMDDFTTIQVGEDTININRLLAEEIAHDLGEKYKFTADSLTELLENRATNDHYKTAKKAPYLYMDHAYFSGLILAKKYLSTLSSVTEIDEGKMDAIAAITLHNSLFKFSLKNQDNLDVYDGSPLAYLLMLCDELQCWNRISFGQNSRNDVFPFGFDLKFEENNIQCTYFYDENMEESSRRSKSYHALTGGKFRNDIHDIIDIEGEVSCSFDVVFRALYRTEPNYMSHTNYLNIYDFALVLNGRYSCKPEQLHPKSTKEEIIALKDDFIKWFDQLSLEFKLSNIAQAKGFAKHLDVIGCFYSAEPSHFPRLFEFTHEELRVIADLEHTRWIDEKLAMGWKYGTDYNMEKSDKNRDRNFKRIHKDIVEFKELTEEDVAKDAEPMKFMVELLSMFDGLCIYRTNHPKASL